MNLDNRIHERLFPSRTSVLAYSSLWESMYDVVSEMDKRGWTFSCLCMPGKRKSACFIRHFTKLGEGDPPVFEELAETLAEATCLAALRATEPDQVEPFDWRNAVMATKGE